MITRKQSAKLGVALCLGVAAVTTVALSMTHTRLAFANPMRGRVLRRKDDVKRAPDAKEREALRKQNPDKPDKRELKIREFKDMPLKIQAIRNVDSETWYKDLQIEVKNIGAKPIYFMLAYLDFPDHKNPQGHDTGIFVTFGDLKNWDMSVLADRNDLHLDPDQTYVFTIPEKMAKGLAIQHRRVPQELKKLDFHIDIISFGDRTGFEIGRPLDLRNTKQPDETGNKKHHGNRRPSLSVRSPPQDGCGSCGRYKTHGANVCFDLYLDEWCPSMPQQRIRPTLVISTIRLIGIAMGMVLKNVP